MRLGRGKRFVQTTKDACQKDVEGVLVARPGRKRKAPQGRRKEENLLLRRDHETRAIL